MKKMESSLENEKKIDTSLFISVHPVGGFFPSSPHVCCPPTSQEYRADGIFQAPLSIGVATVKVRQHKCIVQYTCLGWK